MPKEIITFDGHRSEDDQQVIKTILAKFPTARIGKITVRGDWSIPAPWDQERPRYNYHGGVELYDQHWEYPAELNSGLSENRRDLTKQLCDEVWLTGHSHVIIDAALFLGETDPTLDVRRLISSARRRALVRAEKRREKRRWICEQRVVRADQLADVMAKAPTSAAIKEFYRRWKACTGYGRTDREEERNRLSVAKHNLIGTLLIMARQRSWPYGKAQDAACRNKFNQVLYIETPFGQVSFHVLPGSYGDLKSHTIPWSGVRNSHIVLADLFSQESVVRKGLEGMASGTRNCSTTIIEA